MPEITTLRKPAPQRVAPSGNDSLFVRRRYLQRRSRRNRANERAFAALWVGIAAVLTWIFIVGFAALAH